MVSDDDERVEIRARAHAHARMALWVLGETISAFQVADGDPEVIKGLQDAYKAAYRAAYGEEPS